MSLILSKKFAFLSYFGLMFITMAFACSSNSDPGEYNKLVTISLKMVYKWEKNIITSWKTTLEKWSFTTLGPILRFTLKLVPGIHEPLIFIITILDQKSRNAGTLCISITFSNKLHFLPSLQFALLLLHAIIKEPVMLMDLVNVMLNSQELIATLQVNRYKDMITSTTIYTKVFCDIMSHVIR